jgi:hypothetical protein
VCLSGLDLPSHIDPSRTENGASTHAGGGAPDGIAAGPGDGRRRTVRSGRRLRSSAMPSYAVDIKPLFRERDRGSMLTHFDLWSYEDVVRNKEAILNRLADGGMPCDGPWPTEQVEVFRGWVASGTPA